MSLSKAHQSNRDIARRSESGLSITVQPNLRNYSLQERKIDQSQSSAFDHKIKALIYYETKSCNVQPLQQLFFTSPINGNGKVDSHHHVQT